MLEKHHTPGSTTCETQHSSPTDFKVLIHVTPWPSVQHSNHHRAFECLVRSTTRARQFHDPAELPCTTQRAPDAWDHPVQADTALAGPFRTIGNLLSRAPGCVPCWAGQPPHPATDLPLTATDLPHPSTSELGRAKPRPANSSVPHESPALKLLALMPIPGSA